MGLRLPCAAHRHVVACFRTLPPGGEKPVQDDYRFASPYQFGFVPYPNGRADPNENLLKSRRPEFVGYPLTISTASSGKHRRSLPPKSAKRILTVSVVATQNCGGESAPFFVHPQMPSPFSNAPSLATPLGSVLMSRALGTELVRIPCWRKSAKAGWAWCSWQGPKRG